MKTLSMFSIAAVALLAPNLALAQGGPDGDVTLVETGPHGSVFLWRVSLGPFSDVP